jgi:chromosomal replication initiator protein
VAAQYGLKSTDLKSKTNSQNIVFPRQVAMFLCKELTDLSYPEIGKQFNNKHHSTVMHSVEKIERLLGSDSGLANVVEMLSKQLR